VRRGPGLLALCMALVATVLTACSGGDGDDTVRLRVLAGPDLAVLAPLLGQLKDATGVDLRLEHRADAESRTPDRDRYDLAWLSSDRYLRLTDKSATRGLQRTPTMTSPSSSA
jgi:Ca-activated chloride channel family protein